MMKKRYPILFLIVLLAFYLRFIRYGTLIALPETDMYYYINIYNGLLNNGSYYGAHPGFNLFMHLVGNVTNINFHSLFVYIGPILSALMVLLIFFLMKRIGNFKIGLFAAFIFAVTPVSIIRNGQTIAETLAFVFLIIYIYFLYDYSQRTTKKLLILIPLFIVIFYIHNLTAAVTLFITATSYLFYLFYRKEYVKSLMIIIPISILLLTIYYMPIENLPKFKEQYTTFYKAVKQYLTTYEYGRSWDTLSIYNYDLLFPSILLSFGGMIVSYFKKKKNDIFMLILFLALFFMTQAFRINFYFVPYRFLLYSLIPISYFAGIFLEWIFDSLGNMNINFRFIILAPIILMGLFAYSFDYNFNFIMEDEDFISLEWARNNIEDDNSITTYSKINNRTQNKYTAISNHEIELNNSFFNTGIVDYSLLEIVSNSFDLEIGNNPPPNETVYYTSLEKIHNDYIRLNMGDRCLTSIFIIDTFWKIPDTVGICDGIEYEKGVDIGKEYNLPIILYSNERYGEVMDALKKWGCSVVLIDEIEVLENAFNYKGITYTCSIPIKREVQKLEGTYLFYDSYDMERILGFVTDYLYLSKEATQDFKDLERLLNDTGLMKIYSTEKSSFYIS